MQLSPAGLANSPSATRKDRGFPRRCQGVCSSWVEKLGEEVWYVGCNGVEELCPDDGGEGLLQTLTRRTRLIGPILGAEMALPIISATCTDERRFLRVRMVRLPVPFVHC